MFILFCVDISYDNDEGNDELVLNNDSDNELPQQQNMPTVEQQLEELMIENKALKQENKALKERCSILENMIGSRSEDANNRSASNQRKRVVYDLDDYEIPKKRKSNECYDACGTYVVQPRSQQTCPNFDQPAPIDHINTRQTDSHRRRFEREPAPSGIQQIHTSQMETEMSSLQITDPDGFSCVHIYYYLHQSFYIRNEI